eukprot:scaffold129142_cov26-Tisochrysis_lutea.AAC.2
MAPHDAGGFAKPKAQFLHAALLWVDLTLCSSRSLCTQCCSHVNQFGFSHIIGAAPALLHSFGVGPGPLLQQEPWVGTHQCVYHIYFVHIVSRIICKLDALYSTGAMGFVRTQKKKDDASPTVMRVM